jgi:hypothetical protein
VFNLNPGSLRIVRRVESDLFIVNEDGFAAVITEPEYFDGWFGVDNKGGRLMRDEQEQIDTVRRMNAQVEMALLEIARGVRSLRYPEVARAVDERRRALVGLVASTLEDLAQRRRAEGAADETPPPTDR